MAGLLGRLRIISERCMRSFRYMMINNGRGLRPEWLGVFELLGQKRQGHRVFLYAFDLLELNGKASGESN
jgi:hypothetical protein